MIRGCGRRNWSLDVSHILPAGDPHCRLLAIPRHKGDQEGEGTTAFLSERSVLAAEIWLTVLADLLDVPAMTTGPIFRRLFIKRLKPIDPRTIRMAERREEAARQLGLTADTRAPRAPRRTAIDPMTVVTAGREPLRPLAVTQIFKARLQGTASGRLGQRLSSRSGPAATGAVGEGHQRAFDAHRHDQRSVCCGRGHRWHHGCAEVAISQDAA